MHFEALKGIKVSNHTIGWKVHCEERKERNGGGGEGGKKEGRKRVRKELC